MLSSHRVDGYFFASIVRKEQAWLAALKVGRAEN